MLYTEDTRIEALAVHVVGNKSKDEPLTVSPELSAQVADEGLMRTLTAYFLGGFKSEECYNLHHETDLGCNEVWNFACRIFDDPEALLEHSVSLAKHLYESGMHPQIKGGEFHHHIGNVVRIGDDMSLNAQAAVLLSLHLYHLIFSGIDYHLLPFLSFCVRCFWVQQTRFLCALL